jgi:hypothetical protein
MSRPIVLSLCDVTTTMVRPWLAAGYECWCVDLQHPTGEHREGQLVRVGADLRTWLPPRGEYAIVFAFPPCTHLAVSGARWFREKGLSALIEGLTLVDRCREIAQWTAAPWMLENPVSTISSYWREPDYAFDPCDFGGYLTPTGDAYTKRTCLWTGGGFIMPQPSPVPATEGSRMHLLPPSEERANLRSATPAGFARAVFEANHPWVKQEVSNAA